MEISQSDLAMLRQRALQFLVHSFLYYKLGEPVISDQFFDQLTEELRHLREHHPDAEMPYAELIDPALGAEASGFAIRTYPVPIVTAAFKLLYAIKSSEESTDFFEFAERWGYQALIHVEA